MFKARIVSLICLFAGLAVGTLIRVLMIVAHTDMNTGFLYHGEALLWNLLYYGVLIAAGAGALFAALKDNKAAPKPPKPSDISAAGCTAIGFVTLLAGIAAAYEGYAETRAVTPSGFLKIIDFVFGGLMIAIAFIILYKKKMTVGIGCSYIFIGVYCTLRGMYCFTDRMAITTVPEYLIEILSLIGMIVFFVIFARFASGNSEKLTYAGMSFWGVWTSGLTLSSALATIISSFAAPAEIKGRIVMTTYAAETYRQAKQGVEAYKMTYTPWVNVLLGALMFVVVILAALRKENAEND